MSNEDMRIRVLHVEDDNDWQQRVSSILTEAGYKVVSIGSAFEAKRRILDQVLVEKFAVAILDGYLADDGVNGDGTGAEIAELLRKNPKGNQAPIRIIGLSTGETPWADKQLKKGKFGEGDEFLRTVANVIRQSQG